MRLALVIPCFNEERGIGPLCERLRSTLPTITDDFEVVLVDDGSTDGTLAAARDIAATDDRFRYIALSRNFGKESAMLAGLSQVDADLVAIMDADLQHPPELLATMVHKLEQGYDQVVARRSRTGDARTRSLLSKIFYRLINRLIDVELLNGVGDFRVLSRKAVDGLLTLGEYNRFSKGLFAWIGFDTAVVDYENKVRREGTSKWTFRKLIDYGIDGVISFNNRPLRLAIYLGILFTLVAFGYAIWVLIDAIISGNPVPGYVTIMCGILGLGGLQLLFLGVIGEYLGRTYFETKRRPHFLIKESSGPRVTPAAVTVGSDQATEANAATNRVPEEWRPTSGAAR
jgi:polyisoprenyl-phosphate glycosyltransferase